jgi:hypothetical protein
MAKAHLSINNETQQGVAFWCPGCDEPHLIPTKGAVLSATNVNWGWNGSLEAPTFTPSIFYTDPGSRCHSLVTDGRIQFLGDSDHHLAGQTVELPDWPESEND